MTISDALATIEKEIKSDVRKARQIGKGPSEMQILFRLTGMKDMCETLDKYSQEDYSKLSETLEQHINKFQSDVGVK